MKHYCFCVQVFVQDFTPRLNIDVAQQDFMRQEFHRVAARLGMSQSFNYSYMCNGLYPLRKTDWVYIRISIVVIMVL